MPKKESKRAGNGLGTVRQRKDGLWECRFSIKEEDGTSSQKSVYGATQREAIDKRKKLEEAYRKGLVAKKDGRTFGDFADEWLKRKERSGKAQSTIKSYRFELDLIPESFRDMRLQAIKASHIHKMIDGLATTTRPARKGSTKPPAVGVSPRTQRQVLQTVRAVFKEAMKQELIYKNSAEFVDVAAPPSEPKGQVLEPFEVDLFLEACEGHTMGLFFRLLLGCGLRKGEALALQWKDVNLERGEISISKAWTGSGKGYMTTPKTRNSKRVVPIPPGIRARLIERHKKLLEKDWTAAEAKGLYIFGLTKPLEVNSPNHALNRIVDKFNAEQTKKEKDSKGLIPEGSLTRLPKIRVHDLRHSFGSLALAKGMPLELVSEWMGHANPTITLNVYRHVMEYERKGFVFDLEEMIPKTLQNTQRAQA